MNDFKTEVAGEKAGESNPSSVIIGRSARAFEGRAMRASPMRRPAIDLRALSDDMLIFMLQLMAPEKYGRPSSSGGKMESHQLSVISNESSGKAPLEMKSECGMQIIETGRIESNPLVINNPWTVRNVRSEGSGSFELPESGCEFDPQTAGGELPESGCEFDPQTADGELPESGCEFDPQTAGGELPESGREFDPQIAGGESVMPQDCPEFGGSGDGREGGVKAPEDRRSPNPGGCMEGPEKEVSHWGDRRPWLPAGILPGCAPHEAREIPESGGKDLAQNADGEIVTRVKKVICWPMAPWHEGFATRNLRGREPPPELGLPKPGIPFANLSKDRASETRIGWANSIGRSSRLPHAGPPAV